MSLIAQWQALLAEVPARAIGLTMWLFLVMVLLVPLERRLPLRKSRLLRAGFDEDLVWYFLGGLVPAFFVAAATALATIIANHLPAGWTHWAGALPLPLRIAVTVVAGELAYYRAHRWSHEVPYLWRFHAIHHSPEHVDWLVNTRAHPLDLAFARSFSTAVIVLTGLAQQTDADAVAAIAVFNTSWGFFIHANCRIRLGWLEHVVTTPAFHHWHHAELDDGRAGRNYAALLPWIDRLFGTWHAPAVPPQRFGIAEHLPPGVIGQIVAPFRAPGVHGAA